MLSWLSWHKSATNRTLQGTYVFQWLMVLLHSVQDLKVTIEIVFNVATLTDDPECLWPSTRQKGGTANRPLIATLMSLIPPSTHMCLCSSHCVSPSMPLPSSHTRESQSTLFSFVVPWWWNELPNAIRTGASFSIFKNLLKTHLFAALTP